MWCGMRVEVRPFTIVAGHDIWVSGTSGDAEKAEKIGCSSVSGHRSDRQFKGMAIRVMELSGTRQLRYHILYCRWCRVLQIVIDGAD